MAKTQHSPDLSPASRRTNWLGWSALALGFASTLTYFLTSAGIKNFIGFLGEGVVKLSRMLGFGA